jgi:hypothetical protein
MNQFNNHPTKPPPNPRSPPTDQPTKPTDQPTSPTHTQGHRAVFFLDDINLPFVETYGTQNAIALLTQHLQYGDWFDRGDLVS